MTAIVSSSLSMDQFNKAWPADPLGLLGRLRQDGPVSAIPFDDEDGQLVVAFHPPLISAALVHGRRTHRALLREYVGHGLFVAASGERWRRRRTLMHPLFTVRAASSRHGIVLDTTRAFLSRMTSLSRTDNRPFDLGHTMQRLSIEIILRLVDPALSGPELDTLATALQSAVEFLDQRLFRPDTVAPGQEGTFVEQKKLLDEFIETRVMSAGPNDTGLLAELVGRMPAAAIDEDPASQVVNEEIMSIFIAGVETMGALLTWIFWNLDGNPDALAACLTEIHDTDLTALRAAPELPRAALPYARAVVQETLRLFPPAWALFRTLPAPLDVDGVALSAGDQVLAGTYVTHRDPALWSAPDEFRPDRFLRDQPPTDQYFPFGTGPHQCLGRQFALMEAQLVTAEVLRTGTLLVTGDRATTRLKPAIALTPDPSPTAVFQPHSGGTR